MPPGPHPSYIHPSIHLSTHSHEFSIVMGSTPTSESHPPSSTAHGQQLHHHHQLPKHKYKMDRPELVPRPGTPDKLARSSFSSIREDSGGPTQAFTSSNVSTLLRASEQAIAIVDDSPGHSRSHSPQQDDMATEVQFVPPVTLPNSKLHGNWFPANNFKGWKQINVKGKTASRSFGDLQALHLAWSTPPARPEGKQRRTAVGQAPVEKLPVELLGAIIELLVLDIPPLNGVTRRNMDLMSLLLTSRTMHGATLNALYRNITIPHSRIFRKFLTNISTHQSLGTIIRRIDFSHFNNATLFTSASERKGTQNLTAETLLRCLELTPHLQEFLAMEHIDDDLGPEVLKKLFMGLPRLQALDFAGCTSAGFRTSFASLVPLEWPETLSITRLSFHKCMTLPPSVFETILPRLTHVTHLDLAQTRVTDKALEAIPHTARLTHLNLMKCTLLTAPKVIEFFESHPAVKHTLVYLSVATDARSHQLLAEDDVSALIPLLPKTLKSLSLKGSRMTESHIELLRPFTKHLEELALGRSMDVLDASKLLRPAEQDEDEKEKEKEQPSGEKDEAEEEEEEEEEEAPSTLRFLDLSDLWGAELNLTHLFSKRCALLHDESQPLEVIEVSESSFKSLSRNQSLERMGWTLTEIGSRCWMVRLDKGNDRGHRWWKMGADHWGMRKVPVARAEVGGMYGSFMFGRKL